MSPSSRVVEFARYRWLTLALTLLFGAAFAGYVWAEKQTDTANELRHRAVLLAAELRQSSDELTRMARSYVATGDPAWQRHYREVLDIRDGRSPRPLDYHIVYWDLVLADDARPRPFGPAVALRALMRQAGLTDDELAWLERAKANSDQLTRIELAAMALVPPGAVPSGALLARASPLLHDAAYHRAKADIMRPIMRFQQLTGERTLAAVRRAEARANWARLTFVLACVALVALLGRGLRTLRRALGAPVSTLHTAIARLGRGDFATPVTVRAGLENSIQGWLAETRTNLAAIDTRRVNAEQRNGRLNRFYALLSRCNQIIVRCTSEGQLYSQVCTNLVDSGGMRMVWIGLLDDDGRHIAPAACSGSGVEYLYGLQLSTSAEEAIGRGPSGTAAREGRPVWCQDFLHDAATAPWHARAAQYGWAGSAALPLHRNGKVCGVLTLYVDEIDAFDDEVCTLLLEMASDISYALSNLHREAQRKAAERRIQYLAHHDALTGLLNRARLDELARAAFEQARQAGQPVALILLDLDNFKDINDALGHSVGDAVLSELAGRLRALLGAQDAASRMGGDEFVLLLRGPGAAQAEQMARNMLAAVAAPMRIAQYDLNLTASVGVALYPDHGADVDTLFQRADLAMYSAKHEGRNGYRVFSPSMQEGVARQLQLVHALRQALGGAQLQVHYQPQLAMDGGAIIGAEALLRWTHPELGSVSPAEFIPAAESSGLILALGEWVLRQAVRQARAWMEQGLPPLRVAVNLSAVQLRQPELAELVGRILQEEGLAPRYLELELTESAAMHDPQAAMGIMNSLHARGVRLSIDDFGTGFSSLSYLKQFKIYKLKIDRSFVQDIGSNPEDRAIVAAIVNMARGLGLSTISEGVETAEQLALLRELGSDEVQGYYYSRPLPPAEFAAYALARAHAGQNDGADGGRCPQPRFITSVRMS